MQNAPEGPHEDSHDSVHGKFDSAHGHVHESVLGQFFLFSHVLFLARSPITISSYFGYYSYSFQESVELICITVTVSLVFFTECSYRKDLPWAICRNVLEDFCCINFGGFSRGFSWRIFLGTFSHKNEGKKSGEKIREKIRRLKN